ncbi:Protein CBG25922 [Caenorhabditis briggsae]|uniref:Uncharacterized protein n=2 Tax=Caenorhabditis briggsae TaxID=6238 RepID=A0AAE9DC10_CAEBR|nr:Protein CBG25922 [Caenorhabditis briggsae]ULU01021.1 hypothetical protein L3Y34_001426 [Caenorhabditis briggsae]CAS00284.1 Protein CBG25922 [Caenorhabditis briggsae]
MSSNSTASTRSPPETTMAEFIEKHMSLIIAAVIGTIIIGLLAVTGYMYMTKKVEKKKNSTYSRPKSYHDPSPSRSPTAPSQKSSPSIETSGNSVISGTGSLQTATSETTQSIV